MCVGVGVANRVSLPLNRGKLNIMEGKIRKFIQHLVTLMVVAGVYGRRPSITIR